MHRDRPRRRVVSLWTSVLLLVPLAAWVAGQDRRTDSTLVTVSVVGTTDLHGRVFADDQARGGLALFGGFLENLRASRAADGGAVVLLDAGDTFQGGIESNLSEGALAIDAYNALDYTALAVGNHDFEYGARDLPSLRQEGSDLQGALKAAAARARFPLLAANLVDDATGRPVAWPNVRPSTLVHIAGIPVGIVGVMTLDALSMTLAANVGGLHTTPLAPAIEREATALRAAGARIVLVVSHAGGSCAAFDDPSDLSSCDGESEIFDVARQLPRGLVDAIVAGHTHDRLAHVVNGVPIVQAGALGLAFARVDLTYDRRAGQVVAARPIAPRWLCAWEDATTGACRTPGSGVRPRYESRVVAADARVDRAMAAELARVRQLQAIPIGVQLDGPVLRGSGPESALSNLFADALRAETPGASIALSFGAGPGGLRADLPAGALTFGALYDVFPFDNRVVRLTLTGADIARVLADQVGGRRRGRVTGLSGVWATVGCRNGAIDVALRHVSGRAIAATDSLVVATPEFSAGRTLWGAIPGGHAAVAEAPARADDDRPLVREVVGRWLSRRGGRTGSEAFLDPAAPRWQFDSSSVACVQ